MSICWYCHWGWPKEVRDIHDVAYNLVGESALHYGPAHIVWADENFDSAQWCIDNAESWRREWGITDFEMEVIINSLKKLLELPKYIREAEPEYYDGEHPENYPPDARLIMVKK